MPPESRYRPRRALDTSILGAFFFIFGAAFALLWFSASLMPVFILIAAYFARSFFHRASHVTAVNRNQTAVNLLNAGRIDEAAEIFDQLTETERRTPAHAVYVFNRAVAYILQGRPRRAYSLFNAVLKSRAFYFGLSNSYLPLLYVEMATCLALFGDVDEARRHRDNALRALPPHEQGRTAFLDALILVRTGRFSEADVLIGRTWREAESLLRIPTLKALRLVHAFALEKTDRARSKQFQSLVEGVRPCQVGEFDWIAAEWPQFEAFLRRLGLSSA